MITFNSREFNQDVSRAKREAQKGPVFITDRGRPSHVLINFETYLKLTREKETIVDLLAAIDDVEIDFEASRLGSGWDRREG